MFILPESIKTMINALMAVFAKKEDLKQSDWNQSDNAKLDFIKNKPVEATDDEVMELLMEYDVITLVSDTTGYTYLDADDKILVI